MEVMRSLRTHRLCRSGRAPTNLLRRARFRFAKLLARADTRGRSAVFARAPRKMCSAGPRKKATGRRTCRRIAALRARERAPGRTLFLFREGRRRHRRDGRLAIFAQLGEEFRCSRGRRNRGSGGSGRNRDDGSDGRRGGAGDNGFSGHGNLVFVFLIPTGTVPNRSSRAPDSRCRAKPCPAPHFPSSHVFRAFPGRAGSAVSARPGGRAVQRAFAPARGVTGRAFRSASAYIAACAG